MHNNLQKFERLVDTAMDVLMDALSPYNGPSSGTNWTAVDYAQKVVKDYVNIVKTGITAQSQATQQQDQEALIKQKERLAKLEKLLTKGVIKEKVREVQREKLGIPPVINKDKQ